MTPEMKKLYDDAIRTRVKLIHGAITIDEAINELKHYEKAYNKRGEESAKEFNSKHTPFNARSFLR